MDKILVIHQNAITIKAGELYGGPLDGAPICVLSTRESNGEEVSFAMTLETGVIVHQALTEWLNAEDNTPFYED